MDPPILLGKGQREMTILIATTKVAKDKKRFIHEVCNMASAIGCIVAAMRGVDGPGCYNLAVELHGPNDNQEKFANALTMALGPIARWTTTSETIEGFDLADPLPQTFVGRGWE